MRRGGSGEFAGLQVDVNKKKNNFSFNALEVQKWFSTVNS